MKKAISCKKKCVRNFVLKTAQNLQQLQLVSSVHNENNENHNGVLGIILLKNFSLDFCRENNLVKIRKTCTKLSAALNTV